MATDALQTYNRANSSDFITALQAVVIFQAMVIYAENPATANHANRLVLAKAAFNDPIGVSHKFALTVACAQAVRDVVAGQVVPDGIMLAAVATQWNMMCDAGV